MRALVAGATGFIGSRLVRFLLEGGHEVIAIRRQGSSGWRLEGLKGDLRVMDLEDLLTSRGPDSGPPPEILYNLASYGVDFRCTEIDLLVDGNIKLALRLATLCARWGIPRMVHVGSGFEFENTGGILDEQTPLRPSSMYGCAKAAATMMLLNHGSSLGLPVVVLRPFSVFGPGEGLHRFIPQVMRTLIQGGQMSLTPGDQIRDYLFAEDLAKALFQAAHSKVPAGMAFNVCGDNAQSIKALVGRICKILGLPGQGFAFGAMPYRPSEIMHFAGDDSRFRGHSGWHPEVDLDQAILKTHAWYEANLGRLMLADKSWVGDSKASNGSAPGRGSGAVTNSWQ